MLEKKGRNVLQNTEKQNKKPFQLSSGELKTAVFEGKQIAYSSETEFLVKVGKGRGSYKTRYSFKGQLLRALLYYDSINIGNGYKKRILVPSFNKPVLHRQLSYRRSS